LNSVQYLLLEVLNSGYPAKKLLHFVLCVCGLNGSLVDCLTAVCMFMAVSGCLMMLPWSWIYRPWQVF